MSIIEKNRISDFGGNFDLEQFRDELAASLTKFQDVILFGDTIQIHFSSSIDAGETTTLDDLITNHAPLFAPKRRGSLHVAPKIAEVDTSAYFCIGMYHYNGVIKDGLINYIDIVSKKDADVTSYDLKIIDSSNMDVIAEITGLTNTAFERKDMGILSNLSNTEQTFEFLVRMNGGSAGNVVTVDDILFYK